MRRQLHLMDFRSCRQLHNRLPRLKGVITCTGKEHAPYQLVRRVTFPAHSGRESSSKIIASVYRYRFIQADVDYNFECYFWFRKDSWYRINFTSSTSLCTPFCLRIDMLSHGKYNCFHTASFMDDKKLDLEIFNSFPYAPPTPLHIDVCIVDLTKLLAAIHSKFSFGQPWNVQQITTASSSNHCNLGVAR